jgi:hypothetical protein
MYKTFVFATVIVAGVFLAPVATSAALAVPPPHVAAAATVTASHASAGFSSAQLSVPGKPAPAAAARPSHASVSHAAETALPPVQLMIVWALLALIAVVISFSVRRTLRRSEDDPVVAAE